ncbi:serine/threonine protein kinase, variant [Saprolegnia diclina VS20]|uniref:Serine/threonine protein kinase, variant n=1 Tax=Saprolegnia diclina (strain VS20) TaxID=1156394 RepID=T0QMF0_SAPDV|nr:serine/threonine protein kinase, variant [Saprolegnia diclina VS20]EQC34960.1 serine/threonine protein kinase, variant [Saprolegnia diclina VS20]|eukprot:XP_008611832.1 serine/threonine protein kinase, variant [Saprolegnia diclina VS20]
MMTMLACWRRLRMPQWLGGPTPRTALRLVLFVLASAVYWLFLISAAIVLGLRVAYIYATHLKLRCHDPALSARTLAQATLVMLHKFDTVVLGIYDPSVPNGLVCPSSADDIVEMTPFAAYIALWKGIVGLLCFQLPLSLWLIAIKCVKRFFDRDYYAFEFYPECSLETRPFVLLHACAYVGFGLLVGHALSSLLLQSALHWNRVIYPTPSYTPVDEKASLLSTTTSVASERPPPYEMPARTRSEDDASRLDGYLELWQAVLESIRVFEAGHATLLACLEDTTRLACSTLRASPAQWARFHGLAQRQARLQPTPPPVAIEEALEDDDSVVDTSPIALEKPTPVLFTRAMHTGSDRDYDVFYTDTDAESTATTSVYRDIPDPTGWVSPTAYTATRVLTYDEPERRDSVIVSRGLVSRSVHQALQTTTLTDRVHFAAYAPACVSPASTFSHAIYAFLVHQRDEMREEAMADGVAKQLSRDLLLHVRRGAFVTISLQLPDGFRHAGEASQLLSWTGDVTHVAFEVECCAVCAEGQVLFEATIVVGTSVLVLRSYLFVSSSLRQDAHVQELVSELEVVPETFHEIAYSDLALKEAVGRGHFGDAHRATYLGQDVVVKTLRPNEFGDNADQIVAAFRHEAAVLSLFGRHPNIVPFVGACTDLSQPLSLVTEYLPFGSLEDQFGARRPPLSTDQKTRILCDAASGFLNIHEGGFIHRDIAARYACIDANAALILFVATVWSTTSCGRGCATLVCADACTRTAAATLPKAQCRSSTSRPSRSRRPTRFRTGPTRTRLASSSGRRSPSPSRFRH